MEVFLNAAALAKRCGHQPYRSKLPPHDVEIGRYRGWHPRRVSGTSHISGPLHKPALRLLAVADIAVRLGLSRMRVRDLTIQSTFPPVFAVIGDPQERLPARWLGAAYGWTEEAITTWAQQTGRMDAAGQPTRHSRRGRPPGTGDYLALPRCGRPRKKSVHGKGQLCKGVCRKFGELWGPACGLHITEEEVAAMAEAYRRSVLREITGMMLADKITDEEVAARLAAHKARSPMTAPGQ